MVPAALPARTHSAPFAPTATCRAPSARTWTPRRERESCGPRTQDAFPTLPTAGTTASVACTRARQRPAVHTGATPRVPARHRERHPHDGALREHPVQRLARRPRLLRPACRCVHAARGRPPPPPRACLHHARARAPQHVSSGSSSRVTRHTRANTSAPSYSRHGAGSSVSPASPRPPSLRAHTHTHIHTHTHTHTHTHKHTHTHNAHAQTQACTHTQPHTHIHTHTHTPRARANTSVHTHNHTTTHTHTHTHHAHAQNTNTHTHGHTHTCTHTHTPRARAKHKRAHTASMGRLRFVAPSNASTGSCAVELRASAAPRPSAATGLAHPTR